MVRMLMGACFLALLLAGVGWAGDNSYKSLSSSELKAMMDRKEPGLVVIDTRTPDEYDEAHIRGAINVPWVRMGKDPSLLSYPKETKIVFYCNGFS